MRPYLKEERDEERQYVMVELFFHCSDLLISEIEMLSVQGPQHSKARDPRAVTAQFILAIEYLAQKNT